MTVHRYDYGALYFIKRRYSLGANFRDLTDEERQALQRNRGVYVLSVVDRSPAYENDILRGDGIVSINGQPANGADGFGSMLRNNRGRTVEIAIVRRGQTVSKRISLLE